MRLGLVGKSLIHSFSPAYFTNKFEQLGLSDYSYSAFELEQLSGIVQLLAEPDLLGLNVTIPYKEAVIPYLQALDEHAKNIGAVNTIYKSPIGWTGGNTDWLGFLQSLDEFAPIFSGSAVVIGNGGAAKAIVYALKQQGIPHVVLARAPQPNEYALELAAQFLSHELWINTTPVGQFPKQEEALDLPFYGMGPAHYFYDLVYNPTQTASMKLAQDQGATVTNGRRMLELQAEAAWKIWMDSLNG